MKLLHFVTIFSTDVAKLSAIGVAFAKNGRSVSKTVRMMRENVAKIRVAPPTNVLR